LNWSDILILIATGAFAGLAGGMLGLGGAFVMTPLQYIVYTNMGLDPDIAIKTAFGTSLLVVMTTAISGAWRHHKQGAVNWRMALYLGGVGLIFGFGGSMLSSHVPSTTLKIAFGVIAIVSCVRMFLTAREKEGAEPEKRTWIWALWGIPVGLLSGTLGVGGGVIMVPIMVIVLKLKMQAAAANSLAAIIIISIGGIIGYITNGIGVAGRLLYSVGYIDIPSWIMLAIPAAVTAQVGALLAHRIHRKWLIFIFVTLQLYVGLHMIGVFKWFGWPI
jgi:uncharacterized protein